MFWTRFGALALGVAFSLVVGSHAAWCDEKVSTAAKASEARALVLQALDNEAAGDAAERKQLLEQAVSIDPQYPPAHWHLGRVQSGESWVPASEAMAKAAGSELTAQYAAKRDEASGSPAQELKLAQWCLKQEMPDRARLHFWRVLTNPKANEGQVKDAAKQLDLVSVGGTILTRDELKREQEREQRIAEAIQKYRPILAQLQPPIDGGFDEKHDRAVAKLAAIDDPAVIPAVETFLNAHREGFGEELVKLLVKFPQVEATQTLVRYAVVSPFLSVRERSIAELKNRPLHDYVPTLLAGLVAPIQSQYFIERDRQGNIRYRQVFAQEGAEANVVRQVDQIYRPLTLRFRNGGNPVRSRTLDAVTRANFEVALANEIATTAEEHEFQNHAGNVAANHANGRVFETLEQIIGLQQQRQPQSWWEWWKQYNQVHYPKPTCYSYAYSQHSYISATVTIGSCFIAGTPVWTETGLRPIQSIKHGDRVLSQDADTGELRFKAVLGTTVRPPTSASRLTVNGEAITTTLGHPLWVTGKGWEMAKHVQAGDQLHGVHGIVNVNDIQPLPHKAEAHNLVVDDFNTYFVGNCGMLVHDNTYRKPTRAIVPGLVPDVVSKTSE